MRCAVLAVLVLLVAAAPARAQVFGPPNGKVFTGLTGSNSVEKFSEEVGKRPAVFGFFTYWNASNEYTFRYAEQAGARLMLHISTAQNYGVKEEISPRGIARGQGDAYLLALNARIAEAGEPVYVRLMAEMNQTNNAYCAFNKDGSSRGASHSTTAFKDAWRRSALILRGGSLDTINAKLKQLKLPAVNGADEDLPEPQLSLLWVPQTEGTPNIRRQPAVRVLAGRRVRGLGRHRLLQPLPGLRQARSLLRAVPAQAVRVRRVGHVGRGQPGLRQAALQLGQRPQAREDDGLQPGREPERPVPPERPSESTG